MPNAEARCNNLGFHATKNTSFLKIFLQCVDHVVARSNSSQPKENLLINCCIHIDLFVESAFVLELVSCLEFRLECTRP